MERSQKIGLYGLLISAALRSIHHIAGPEDLIKSVRNVPESAVSGTGHLAEVTASRPLASTSSSQPSKTRTSANTLDPKGLPDAKQDATVMASTGPDTDQLTDAQWSMEEPASPPPSMIRSAKVAPSDQVESESALTQFDNFLQLAVLTNYDWQQMRQQLAKMDDRTRLEAIRHLVLEVNEDRLMVQSDVVLDW